MGQEIFRYLALGDSYTIGEKIPPATNWPNQLNTRLRLKGFDLTNPSILAETGWTTRDLLEALDTANLQGPFELVSLLIGVNNQYQELGLEEYREDFSQLLNLAVDFTSIGSKQIIVLSIPDWGVTPFADDRDRAEIKKQIDQFNLVNRIETQRKNAHYFDITTISRQLGDDPTFLANDLLHPSEKMYSLWVDLIFPTAHMILRNLKAESNA